MTHTTTHPTDSVSLASLATVGSLNPWERETVVNASDGDDHVTIWTAQRRALTRLRKNAKAVEVRTGYHGTTEWAEFKIAADQWNPVSGIKSNRTMTDEQKAAGAARLAAARAAKPPTDPYTIHP